MEEIIDQTEPEVTEANAAENERMGVTAATVREEPPKQVVADESQDADQDQEPPAGENALPQPIHDVLELPATAPSAHALADEARENLGMLTALAKEEGVPISDAQSMVGVFYSLNQMFEDQGLDPRDPDYIDRVQGALRRSWGSSYDQNLADARAAFKSLSPKTQRWLNETGGGDNPAVLSILAAMKNGMFKMTPAQAEAEMAALRKDSAALKSDSHPKHRGMKLKFRMLAELAARGEGQSDLDRLKADVKGKDATPNAATKDLDQQLADLRLHPAYADKRHASNKEVWARYWTLMEKRWPGVHNAGGA